MRVMGYREDHGLMEIGSVCSGSQLCLLVKNDCEKIQVAEGGETKFFHLTESKIRIFKHTIEDQAALQVLEDASNMQVFGFVICATLEENEE